MVVALHGVVRISPLVAKTRPDWPTLPAAMLDLAPSTASPNATFEPANNVLASVRSIANWGSGAVSPEDAQTATAPPLGESMSASAILSVYTS